MNRDKKIIKISIFQIIINFSLVLIKSVIIYKSQSISLFIDTLNNLVDAFLTFLIIISTKISQKKADKIHPYGYGRVEYISCLIIIFVILIVSINSCYDTIKNIYNIKNINYSNCSFFILFLAFTIKFFYSINMIREGNKIKSNNIIVTGKDSLLDSLLSLLSIFSAFLLIKFNINLDGYFGIIISFFIMQSCYEILIDTFRKIIGTDISIDKKSLLKNILLESDRNVLDVKDIKVHSYGSTYFIGNASIKVDKNMRAFTIENITQKLEKNVYEKTNVKLSLQIYT